MIRYEIIEWDGQYNIADNNYLNLVVFAYGMSKEQALRELVRLEGCPGCGCKDGNHAQECSVYYTKGYGQR
jgi:hypothetical protein